MANTTRQELADALERVIATADRGVVRSSAMTRTDRERLVKSGYLAEIFKGWYFLTQPSDETGQSTAWYAMYWDFLAVYLHETFGESYCLSAPSSIDVHLGLNTVPNQVIVMIGAGGNRVQQLPFDTTLTIYKAPPEHIQPAIELNELRVMPLPLALMKVPPTFFTQRPLDAEIALRTLRSPAELIRVLLDSSAGTIAGRMIGAYQFLGETQHAKEIAHAMSMAGVSCKIDNPFEVQHYALPSQPQTSPYASRIRALFNTLREQVLEVFEDFAPPARIDEESYLKRVDDVYQHDAYNSLSIEGYQVTPALIQRIRDREWNPDLHQEDRRESDAFAAKGYLESFNAVKASIRKMYRGEHPVDVLRSDLTRWYQALFSPAVTAGLLEPRHLAGVRNDRVFTRGSRHVPPPHYAVTDSLDALFDALKAEESPIVRAVLGHFLFVYIHPYMDGNGRTGRFLMNALLAGGGYPWTIIRVSERATYMSALEKASCNSQIEPLAKFIKQEMQTDWSTI